MRIFTTISNFGATSEFNLGDDNVLRNSIGRAAMDDQVRDLRKFYDISDAVVQATADARDADIRAFMGLNLEENIGEAINRHLKKQIKASRALA